MEVRGSDEVVDGLIEPAEGVPERVRQVIGGIDEGGRARAEDAQVDLGAEEGDAQPEAGEGVAVRPGHAFDEAVQAEASEIVGHRAARVGGEAAAEQGRDVRAEVTVAEADREMREAAQGLEEGHHPWVTEAQGRDAPAVLLARGLELGEGVLAQRAGVADALDGQQLLVDAGTRGPQLR